jgi:hypothetical protein
VSLGKQAKSVVSAASTGVISSAAVSATDIDAACAHFGLKASAIWQIFDSITLSPNYYKYPDRIIE